MTRLQRSPTVTCTLYISHCTRVQHRVALRLEAHEAPRGRVRGALHIEVASVAAGANEGHNSGGENGEVVVALERQPFLGSSARESATVKAAVAGSKVQKQAHLKRRLQQRT